MSDLGTQAFGLLWGEFGKLVKDGDSEAQEKARVMAEGIALYWLRAAQGDPRAQKDMEFLQSELGLFVARYNVAASAQVNAWLNVVLQVGQVLVGLLLSKGVVL